MVMNIVVISNLFNTHIGNAADMRHEIVIKFKMLKFNINLDCSHCMAHILECRILYANNIVAVNAIVKNNSEILLFKPTAFEYFKRPVADTKFMVNKYSRITLRNLYLEFMLDNIKFTIKNMAEE